ncbi:hypothetical protein L1887_43230 [Cichorium endivia]|nr:hypothetical protein L1887_43230 [Cichorium endivia]
MQSMGGLITMLMYFQSDVDMWSDLILASPHLIISDVMIPSKVFLPPSLYFISFPSLQNNIQLQSTISIFTIDSKELRLSYVYTSSDSIFVCWRINGFYYKMKGV